MNRLHLFVLIFVILFVPVLVSVLSTAPQTAHADDDKPPIDFWLKKGSIVGEKEDGKYYNPEIEIKKKMSMGKYIPRYTRVIVRILAEDPVPRVYMVKQHSSLNTYLYSDKDEQGIPRNVPLMEAELDGAGSWWYGYSIEGKAFLYKNGNLVRTKTFSINKTPGKNLSGMYHEKISLQELGTFQGLCVFHIEKVTVQAEYYKEKNSFVAFEDKVFAFQIGNDEFCDNFDNLQTVTNISSDTFSKGNATTYEKAEDAKAHPYYIGSNGKANAEQFKVEAKTAQVDAIIENTDKGSNDWYKGGYRGAFQPWDETSGLKRKAHGKYLIKINPVNGKPTRYVYIVYDSVPPKIELPAGAGSATSYYRHIHNIPIGDDLSGINADNALLERYNHTSEHWETYDILTKGDNGVSFSSSTVYYDKRKNQESATKHSKQETLKQLLLDEFIGKIEGHGFYMESFKNETIPDTNIKKYNILEEGSLTAGGNYFTFPWYVINGDTVEDKGTYYLASSTTALKEKLNTLVNDLIKNIKPLAISEDGDYRLTVYDKAGNRTQKEFTISNNFSIKFLDSNDNQITEHNNIIYVNRDTRIFTQSYRAKDRDHDQYTNWVNQKRWCEVEVSGGISKKFLRGEGIRTDSYNWQTNSRWLSYFIPLDKEGTYDFTFTDEAGTKYTKTVVVDYTPPTVTAKLNGTTETYDGVLYLNNKSSEIEFSVHDRHLDGTVTLKSTKNGVEQAPIQEEAFGSSTTFKKHKLKFDKDTQYTIVVADKAGNTKEYRVVFDTTAPDVSISGNYRRKDDTVYTNDDISVQFVDENGIHRNRISISRIFEQGNETILKDKDTIKYELEPLDISCNETKHVLNFSDRAGNIRTITIMSHKEDFEKKAEHQKLAGDYTEISYYEINLDPKYGSHAGKYVFRNLETAQRFFINAEWEWARKGHRVEVTSNNQYIYFSPNSDKQRVRYRTKEEVNKRIMTYAAKKNIISIRKVNDNLQLPQGHWIDDDLCESSESYNKVDIDVPEYIKAKGLKVVQLRHTHQYKVVVNNFFYTNKLVRYQYIGSLDGEDVREPKDIVLNRNIYDGDNITEEGFYLVTEYDECGNQYQYIAYLDLTPPELTAKIGVGNGKDINEEYSDKVITKQFLADHGNELRLLALQFLNLRDAVDKHRCSVTITGDKTITYLNGDKFEQLDTTNGGGRYTVCISDRSGNKLEFIVRIPQGIPTWKHVSSLDESKVDIKFVAGRENDFTEINIYRVNKYNKRTPLTKDSNGTFVNAGNVEYEFRQGGKYLAVHKDLYNRVVTEGSFFFYKDLPNGTLSVPNGALTNKSVFFEYNSKEYDAEIFTTTDKDEEGDREVLDGGQYKFKVINAEKSKISVPERDDLDYTRYLIQLTKKDDPETFSEYTFRMDCVLSPTSLADTNDEDVDKGSIINKDFKIKYQDKGLNIRYSGPSGDGEYREDSLFTKEGKYRITVTDDAGNKEVFDMQIDKHVSFDFSHQVKKLREDYYITNQTVRIFDQEKALIDGYESGFADYIVVGKESWTTDDAFSENGVYEIEIRDHVGNVRKFYLEIDKVPPALNISAERTKDSVQVDYEDCEKIRMTKDGSKVDSVHSGDSFSEAGTYRITVTDDAGNSAEKTFVIKKEVLSKLSVPDKAVTTREVQISYNSVETGKYPVQVTISRNGEEVADGRMRDVGKYTVKFVDDVGNKKEFSFEIIGTKMQRYELKLADGHEIKTVYMNQKEIEKTSSFNNTGKYKVICKSGTQEYELDFAIDNIKPRIGFRKKGSTLRALRGDKKKLVKSTLYKNGKEFKKNYNFSPITESGTYKLVVEDEFGNVAEVTKKFRKSLNNAGLIAVLVVVFVVVGVAIAITIFAVKSKKKKVA